jgi:hypothetical protein
MPSKWFLIVRDGRCPECGLVASSVPETALGTAIVDEARRWSRLLDSHANTRSLTKRRSPEVWSALEYGGHVRDTLALFTDRIGLALTRDDPRFVYQDQDTAVIDGRYNESDPRVVATELLANAEQLKLLLEPLPEDSWRRSGTRLEGERFDIALLARFALHEARHHRADAERSALA